MRIKSASQRNRQLPFGNLNIFQFQMLLRSLLNLLAMCQLLKTVYSQSIPLKPILIPLPEIIQSYDVVHASLYRQGDSKFAAIHPPNFYIQKALREKPNLPVSEADKSASGSESNQLVLQNPSKKDTKQTTALTADSPKKSLSGSALDTNRDNQIQWMVQATSFPPMFVVENGMQVKLTEAPLKEASTVEYVEEGKFPTPPTPLNPQGTTKPIDQRQPINSHQPQIIEGSSPLKSAPSSPPHLEKQATQKNFSSEVERQRLTQHRKNLVIISLVVLVLLVVFLAARSQRNKKKNSMSQLHSRFQQYKEEEQIEIFKENEKGFQGEGSLYAGRGLTDDDYSDQEEIPTQQNTLIE